MTYTHSPDWNVPGTVHFDVQIVHDKLGEPTSQTKVGDDDDNGKDKRRGCASFDSTGTFFATADTQRLLPIHPLGRSCLELSAFLIEHGRWLVPRDNVLMA